VLGEEAHIRSEQPDGPRFDQQLPSERIDSYANLILLCPTHHTIADKSNGVAWSIDEITGMKNTHEQEIEALLGSAGLKARDLEELLVARLAIWESKAYIDQWDVFTSYLNDVEPKLPEQAWHDLFDLSAWLLKLRWPAEYPKIASAFENHRRVLTLLAHHLSDSFEFRGGWYAMDRPHTRIGWDPVLYTRLLSDLNINNWIVWILTAELTRSVNLIFTAVIAELDPVYRFDAGDVLMSDGDIMAGRSLSRLEYTNVDWTNIPYEYSLNEVDEKVRTVLHGGDPRNGASVDSYSIAIADWLAEGLSSAAEANAAEQDLGMQD
jgi:hypothetical protein